MKPTDSGLSAILQPPKARVVAEPYIEKTGRPGKTGEFWRIYYSL
jgi:hypothetical protein